VVSNICPRCGFPNDPGVTTCRKCKAAYSDSQAGRQGLDIYGTPAPSATAKATEGDPNATMPLMPSEQPDTSYMVIPRTKTHPKAVVVPIPSAPGGEVTPVTAEKPSSAPPAKLNLDFSDEAPPGEGPVAVTSDLKREIPHDRRSAARVAAPVHPPAEPAPAPPVAGFPRSKGIRITMPEEPAAPAGAGEKAEPSELGRAQEFSDAGPSARSSIHKAATHPSKEPGAEAARRPGKSDAPSAGPSARGSGPTRAGPMSIPGIPVRESWIEYSEPLAQRDLIAAGFIRRLVAAAIDGALVGAAGAAVAWLGVASYGSSPELSLGMADPGKALAALGLPLGLLLASIVGLYALSFHFLSGRTIGKMVRLRVITTAGEPLSIWRALGRTAACAATVGTFLIGFLWILVDDRGQALHDKIAGTYVIVEED
jgi:uncharacterized RDD family membrane protein YckC